MKIKYSPHAKTRLRQRYVTKSQVRLTLLNPDSTSQADRDRFITRKKLNGKTLEVIYVVENNHLVIVTLYYEKTISKN